MTFQFRCPGGCLLQGEPAQAGSTINCPICGQMFVIPAPIAAAPQQLAQPHAPAPQTPMQQQPQAPMQPHAPQPHAPEQTQAPLPQAAQPQAPAQQPTEPAQPQAAASGPIKTSPAARILGASYRVLTFPCPCGQWVEAPRELSGQQATCPHCSQLFQLLETESREYREAVEIARRRREARVGNAWLNWAIAVAVFVLIGLAALIIKSQLDN